MKEFNVSYKSEEEFMIFSEGINLILTSNVSDYPTIKTILATINMMAAQSDCRQAKEFADAYTEYTAQYYKR